MWLMDSECWKYEKKSISSQPFVFLWALVLLSASKNLLVVDNGSPFRHRKTDTKSGGWIELEMKVSKASKFEKNEIKLNKLTLFS